MLEQVPLLLFSAGIADVIAEALRQQARMPNTCHIVSNEMVFDDEGHLTGKSYSRLDLKMAIYPVVVLTMKVTKSFVV